MAFEIEFVPLTVEEVPQLASDMKADGWRFVQLMCVNTEDGLDMIYSFMKGTLLSNHEIKGIKKGTVVPSITDKYLEAFFFENESHELFGVDISNIAIDFADNFYALSEKEPMTIITPEQKAAREKAKKVAAAKAAKEKKAAEGGSDAKPKKKSAMDDAALEEKLAGMDPEKAAKVRAAMEAKAKKEAADKEAKAREKMKDLDPEKAAKVQAALEAKKAREAAAKNDESTRKDGE